MYLASTVCFVSTTIGLIVALEIAQATSNQAVVSRFNFYLQVFVFLLAPLLFSLPLQMEERLTKSWGRGGGKEDRSSSLSSF